MDQSYKVLALRNIVDKFSINLRDRLSPRPSSFIHTLSKTETISNEKEDIFYKNHGIKLTNFTRPTRM